MLLATPSIHRVTRGLECGLASRFQLAPIGGDYVLPSGTMQQAHGDPHDQRAAVRLGLDAQTRAKPTALQIRGPNRQSTMAGIEDTLFGHAYR
jgi:hypothetical protein